MQSTRLHQVACTCHLGRKPVRLTPITRSVRSSRGQTLLVSAKSGGNANPRSGSSGSVQGSSQSSGSAAKSTPGRKEIEVEVFKPTGEVTVEKREIREGPSGSSSSSSTSVQASSQSASSVPKASTKPPAGGRKEVELEVEVYKPNGESTVEKRTIQVNPAEVGTKRVLETPTEARLSAAADRTEARTEQAIDQTEAVAEQAIDSAADVVEQGVGQAADVAQDAAEVAQDAAETIGEGIEQGAEQLQEGADQAQVYAEETLRDFERTADQAADQAQDLLNSAAEQARSVGQQAVDGIAGAIPSVTQGTGSASTVTGAPFANQPLTSMPANPWDHHPGRKPSQESQLQYHKLRLLEAVAGLDRGFAANPSAASFVEGCVLSLPSTANGKALNLTWSAEEGSQESTMQQLGGTWRLVYSSGFATGSIGGRRPGPPAGLIPFQLGQIYQVISPYTGRLDNVVELYSKLELPSLPGLPEPERAVLTATLRHSFEAVGGSVIQITFEDTEIKATGGLGGYLGRLPELALPQLPEPFRPSREARTSKFDVLYLDNDLRITRGSKGELRVFVKA